MRFIAHLQEVITSPYYRARPVDAIKFSYSKWAFSRARIEDPLTFLEHHGIDPRAALEGFDRWAELLEGVVARVRAKEGHQGGVSREDGIVLYGVTRALKPDYIIETGVAAGVSSSFISAALIENGTGQLFSIELPPKVSGSKVHDDGGVFAWPNTGVGWATPQVILDRIADRRSLILEDARSALPALLKRIPYVDVFFHDDLHTPDHMLWEYELIWPHLRKGGMMLSDDSNYGWVEFIRRYRSSSRDLGNLQRLTAMRKT